MTFEERYSAEKLTREEAAYIRAKCDNDLLFFTRLFYRLLRGTKFLVNDHHEELSNHFNDVKNYKVKLLNINIPPRHSKTELALNFIARGIGENQSSNWLYISASDELRAEASTRIRDIVTHPLYKRLYGLELKKDQNSKNLWRTTKGGGLKTATIFGQVTGFGAGQMTKEGFNKEALNLIRTFEGCQVWDDLNKTEDSEAENANNDKVSRVVFNTLLSRENSYDTPIIHIQQRTGISDATASLMDHFGTDNDKYRFVVMPIIKKDGTPLWASKFPLEEINKLKTSPKTSHVFESQYMQNPNPKEDVIFPGSELIKYELKDLNLQNAIYRCGTIDVADEGTDNLSFPIGVLIGNLFYVTDWVFSKENTEYTSPLCAAKIKEHNLDVTICESNNHGAQFIRTLQSLSNAYIAGVQNTTNKHGRIIQEAQTIRTRFAFRSDVEAGSDYHKAMQQLTRYRKKKSGNNKDDAPDSLAMLSALLREAQPDLFY